MKLMLKTNVYPKIILSKVYKRVGVGNDTNKSWKTWGWGGIDHFSRVDVTDNRAQLNGFSGNPLIYAYIVHMFFLCLPHY